jgi:hypothetical protein
LAPRDSKSLRLPVPPRDLELTTFLPCSCNCRQPMLRIARPIAALPLGLKDPGWGYELRNHCRSKRSMTMRMTSMLDVIAAVPGQFATSGMGSMSCSSLPSRSMTGIAMSVARSRGRTFHALLMRHNSLLSHSHSRAGCESGQSRKICLVDYASPAESSA